MTDPLPDLLGRALAGRARELKPEWPALPAAVLVPLYQDDRRWHVLYTLRTDHVEAHRGQVSFPGGRIEPEDGGPEGAALREAEEEIGLRPQDVRLLGLLDSLLTVTQFRVDPVVGVIPWPYPLQVNATEVALAFGVPLEWLADPAHVEMRARLIRPEGPEVPVYYFKPYQGQVIWGATARITMELLELIAALRE
jgi:8-oxo-dGTP pyrophosphatase MutT (NUDIX family)